MQKTAQKVKNKDNKGCYRVNTFAATPSGGVVVKARVINLASQSD